MKVMTYTGSHSTGPSSQVISQTSYLKVDGFDGKIKQNGNKEILKKYQN